MNRQVLWKVSTDQPQMFGTYGKHCRHCWYLINARLEVVQQINTARVQEAQTCTKVKKLLATLNSFQVDSVINAIVQPDSMVVSSKRHS